MTWVKTKTGWGTTMYTARGTKGTYIVKGTGARFGKWEATLDGKRIMSSGTMRAAKSYAEWTDAK
jgi:hypothetical protein